jgi:hypothetical protein
MPLPRRTSLRAGISLALVAIAAIAACGTARIVSKTPVGGTIELEGDHNKAMEQANQEMADHCGLSNFTVLSEGAEPADADNAAATPPETTHTAYRVRYQCDDGAPLGTAQPQPDS